MTAAVSAFEPADGKQARWRYAYDIAVSKEPGDEITLLELAEALGLDYFPDDREMAQLLWTTMSEAKRHLEMDGLHSVRTVPRFGWVVMRPDQNLDEADARRRKARRAVDRTARLLKATDVDVLSPHQRQRHDFLSSSVTRAAALFDRKSKNLNDLEQQSRQRRLPK